MRRDTSAKPVVEVSDEGELHLSSAMVRLLQPRARFVVEVQGENVVLSPERPDVPAFWKTARPQERVDAFRRWVGRHRDGPNLPAESLRRENMYD